jgi:hypothetical protein
LPRLGELVNGSQEEGAVLAWASLYLQLIWATLELAVYGHLIVGCLRLVGFNVFRNTYKPLLSESIVDFWNRYYYYFKELLVEFFFYPTYLRIRWADPWMRLFLAVFAAAFAGNMYYHVLTKPDLVLSLDLQRLWAQWGPRSVYCLLLALGIWISMMRQQISRAAPGKATFFIRLRRITGVVTFYAIIQIWNIRAQGAGVGDRLEFFFSLFGI